ncbi:MAG: hypothetical protein ABJB76_10860 [Candidatus Nitrosocosmicus sp.]
MLNGIELIDKIGSAQMEKEMMDKIIKLAKINEQKMSEETGVYSSM